MILYGLPNGDTITEDQMKKLLSKRLFTPNDYKARLGGYSAYDIIRILESKGIPAFEILYADALDSVFNNDLGDYGIVEVIVPDEKKKTKKRR